MAKLNKWISDLTLRLGPIQTTGALTGVREGKIKSKKPTFKFITPEGAAVKQRYIDDDGNTFTVDQLGKATVVVDDEGNETLVPVDKEAIAKAKESSLPKNIVNLTVHPAAQVDRALYPSEANGYVFTPHDDDPANVAWYDLLLRLVQDSGNAFVSKANVRGNDGLYRISAWNGRIVLQRVLYPTEVNQYSDAPVAPIDSTTVEKFESWVTTQTTPFDPDLYEDNVAARLAAMQEAFASGDVEYDPAPMPVETVEVDLLAALSAFEVTS